MNTFIDILTKLALSKLKLIPCFVLKHLNLKKKKMKEAQRA